MIRKTIVIIGASSFVGSNLAYNLRNKYRVIGTYYNNYVKIPGVIMVPCDVLSRKSIQMVLYTFRPEFTIYATGLSKIEDCDRHEKMADALNSIGVLNAATFTERYRSKFVYLSSGYVFSGEGGKRKEQDTPDPTTRLGKTKAQAEFFIQKSCLNYLIFRSCYFYGRSVSCEKMTWFEYMQRSSHLSKGISLDSSIQFGFLDIYYLSFIIEYCLERDVTNRLFQISSSDTLTFFDFSKIYMEVFQDTSLQVRKSNWHLPEVAQNIGRGGDGLEIKQFLLDIENVESFMNLKFPNVRESLEMSYRLEGGSQGTDGPKRSSNIVTFI